jgi:hypothetical protein
MRREPTDLHHWTLCATAKVEGDLDRIQYAAEVTSDRLKRRYDLRADP